MIWVHYYILVFCRNFTFSSLCFSAIVFIPCYSWLYFLGNYAPHLFIVQGLEGQWGSLFLELRSDDMLGWLPSSKPSRGLKNSDVTHHVSVSGKKIHTAPQFSDFFTCYFLNPGSQLLFITYFMNSYCFALTHI